MPECAEYSGIYALMVMVVDLMFDNHPFAYAGEVANIWMWTVSRSWRRGHIYCLRHGGDADGLRHINGVRNHDHFAPLLHQ